MRRLTDLDIEFIERHLNDDPIKLRLKHHGDDNLMFLVDQIECRRRTASKLNATLKNRHFIFPDTLAAEQSTSDTLASFHASLIPTGATVLDMTCGLGIDAFHCANRASSVTAIDIDRNKATAASINAMSLGCRNVEVICADSVEWLKSGNRKFDVIFIDPARRGDNGQRLYALTDCKPDITACLDLLLSRCGKLIVKASPMLDISAVRKEIGLPCDIIAVGSPRECKELDIIIPGNDILNAVTIFKDGSSQDFSTKDDGHKTKTKYGEPSPGMFLYEPYPAVMKAGIITHLSSRFSFLEKLHANTHLYVSHDGIDTFPGKRYRILDVTDFNKRAMKTLSATYPRMSVTTRNFPLSAKELSHRMKLHENSMTILFGATSQSGPKLIVTTPG